MNDNGSDLVGKIQRHWINLRQSGPEPVVSKAQVTKLLYHGRCPIERAGPFKKSQMPPKRFAASMTEAELDIIVKAGGARPRSCLEIGSFWGDTAILIARKLDIPVVCNDTWLGGLAVWKHPPPKGFLYQGKEIPPAAKFYAQFAANVSFSGQLDKITNVRLPSPSALRLMASKGLRFDMIYVDGSHDYIDVFIDIALAANLLTDEGFMFGDDFQNPDVRDAVNDYCAQTGQTAFSIPTVREEGRGRREYWMIQRPGAQASPAGDAGRS